MLLTPESSVLAQKALGGDIIIPLDELPPYHTEPAVLEASLARSHRWMARRWAVRGRCRCMHRAAKPALRRGVGWVGD